MEPKKIKNFELHPFADLVNFTANKNFKVSSKIYKVSTKGCNSIFLVPLYFIYVKEYFNECDLVRKF